MTKKDVYNIFGYSYEIQLSDCISVTVESFLEFAGFKNAPNNPTKQDLHDIDKGVKGYADLIESGNYDY